MELLSPHSPRLSAKRRSGELSVSSFSGSLLDVTMASPGTPKEGNIPFLSPSFISRLALSLAIGWGQVKVSGTIRCLFRLDLPCAQCQTIRDTFMVNICCSIAVKIHLTSTSACMVLNHSRDTANKPVQWNDGGSLRAFLYIVSQILSRFT